MIKNKTWFLLSTVIIGTMLLPSTGMAGNVKKVFINVAKEGNKAQTNDIPTGYAGIPTAIQNLVYDFTVSGTNRGTLKEEAKLVPNGLEGFGNSLLLNGKGYVELPNSTSLQYGTGDFSYGMWAKFDDLNGTHQMVCKKGGGSYEIEKSGDRINMFAGGTSTYVSSSSNFRVKAGEWNHFMVVKKAGIMYLYVNGQLDNQLAVSFSVSPTGILTFGRDSDMGVTYQYMKGQLDELNIWKRALNPEEIKKTMEKGLKGTEDGLVSYWKF